MCWFTVDTELIKGNIATDNIVCNKIVTLISGKIESAFIGFPYELNEVYSINKDLFIFPAILGRGTGYGILEGFHSYSTNVIYKYDNACINVYNKNVWINSFSAYFYTGLSIASCIIPKGSTYYLNELGEYVSDKIKILTVFKIKEK